MELASATTQLPTRRDGERRVRLQRVVERAGYCERIVDKPEATLSVAALYVEWRARPGHVGEPSPSQTSSSAAR
jgi:hypothetical protein